MLMLMFELLGGAAGEEEIDVGIKLSAQAMVHPQLLTPHELLICFSDEAGQSPSRELPAWIWDCRCGQPVWWCRSPGKESSASSLLSVLGTLQSFLPTSSPNLCSSASVKCLWC